MEIPFEKRARPTRDVLLSQLGDEIVMLDLASERYFGLDSVGKAAWGELTTAPTIGAAIEALVKEYDVDPETLKNDVCRLVEELVANGLLELSDAEAA